MRNTVLVILVSLIACALLAGLPALAGGLPTSGYAQAREIVEAMEGSTVRIVCNQIPPDHPVVGEAAPL